MNEDVLIRKIMQICGDVEFCIFKAQSQGEHELCEGYDDALMHCPIIKRALEEKKDDTEK